MALKDQNFYNEYQSNSSHDPKSFYKSCFNNSNFYRRASGFFSSSIYLLFKSDVLDFVNNGGVIEILCSEVLSNSDIEIINNGYESKKKFEEKITEEVVTLLNKVDMKDEVDFIATLIKFDKLRIKIAFYENGSGIFHEKVGYFKDRESNILTFSGSMNESVSGISGEGNFERIKVFKSWVASELDDVTRDIEFADNIWENKINGLSVIDFPDVPKQSLVSRSKDDLGEINFPKLNKVISKRKIDNLEDYQQEAIDNWIAKGHKGILKHATGSGKTISAIYALSLHIQEGHPAIILVPSQLLLKQWYEEIKNEIPDCIILRCGGGHSSWRGSDQIKIILNSSSSEMGCVILAVMNTASSSSFQNNIMIIIDEVHAVGSNNNQSILKLSFSKRLGLSATPERYLDPDGTNLIMIFFEGIVEPEIDLVHSIKKGRLVNYEYFPKITHLNAVEEDEWVDLTNKIINFIRFNEDKKNVFKDPVLQNMLIKRSRIAKKAQSKIQVVVDILEISYQKEEFWLVYCEDQEQLEEINKLLLERNYSPYIYTTSMEGSKEEELKAFKSLGGIMLSIRCLDEGIDIPQISHAIIAASSQNPRQFIQRRGRVLRSFPGKLMAVIYDCFVCPNNNSNIEKFASLMRSEIKRGLEFASTAKNHLSADSTLRQILINMSIDPNDVFIGIDEIEDENG